MGSLTASPSVLADSSASSRMAETPARAHGWAGAGRSHCQPRGRCPRGLLKPNPCAMKAIASPVRL